MRKLDTNTVKPDVSFLKNEVLNRLMSIENEEILDAGCSFIVDYLTTNPFQTIISQTEAEKDTHYATMTTALNDLQKTLRDLPLSFYLTRPQYRLLTDILIKKLEYDVDTLFIALEVSSVLGGMKKIAKYRNDDELQAFEMDPTQVTYIYHLISKYKVVGLGLDSYSFAEILIRIGEISKVVNYYDTTLKNLSSDIVTWYTSFSPVTNPDDLASMSGSEVTYSETLEPQSQLEQ